MDQEKMAIEVDGEQIEVDLSDQDSLKALLQKGAKFDKDHRALKARETEVEKDLQVVKEFREFSAKNPEQADVIAQILAGKAKFEAEEEAEGALKKKVEGSGDGAGKPETVEEIIDRRMMEAEATRQAEMEARDFRASHPDVSDDDLAKMAKWAEDKGLLATGASFEDIHRFWRSTDRESEIRDEVKDEIANRWAAGQDLSDLITPTGRGRSGSANLSTALQDQILEEHTKELKSRRF